jgi:glycine/D-amino acid oxidase-like deaminating enzyme
MTPSFSFWEQQSFFSYDILIVGSGIVGLSAAIFLKEKQPHLKIAILERGLLPSGASTKNAGFACFGSISELIETEKNSGRDNLHQLIEKRWKGLLKLRALLGETRIDFQNNGGYELFRPGEAALAQDCMAHIDYYNELVKDILDHSQAFFVANEEIAGLGFHQVENLIGNRFEAQIDTGKMMFALIQKALSTGVLILNRCEVERIDPDDGGIRVCTPFANFHCKKLLLTTNAFTRQLLPDMDVVPGRGQVLVTRPLTGLKFKGIFHYDKGYYYFRNIGDRVILGGGRNLDFEAEATTEFGLTDKVQNHLEELLREIILPGTPFEIEHRWSGIMAFGSQVLPIIKRVAPGLYCAVRGSGMGIAMGTQTGQDLANLVSVDA